MHSDGLCNLSIVVCYRIVLVRECRFVL